MYERYGGGTSLLTSGTTGGNGAYDAIFRGVSADGKRVFFRTAEALVSADTDLTPDVYSANVPGTVTVQLNAMPDHAQDFAFTAIGLELGSFNFGPLGFGPTTFSLDDDLDPMLADAEVFGQVTPGVGYSVSQAVPAGWDLTSATCDDGSPVANIDVDAGEEINCTFTDQKRGRVVVVVDAVPNDAQDFSFTAGGGLTPTSVSLDDDSDGTLPNSATLNDVPTGSRLLALAVGARRLGPGERHLQRRQPDRQHQRGPGRDGHLHLHEPQARPDRGRQGRAAGRRAGLRLHARVAG